LDATPEGRRTDARGVVSQFSYDDAGRITAATYPGESVSNVTYTYDSVTGGNKGIGRLTGVTDAAGTAAYVYDILGRTIEEERVIGSETSAIAYEYDPAGNVANVTYPSGRKVFFDRDDDGKTQAIRTLPSGGSMAWLVQWVGRTPFGPRSGILFGNDMREVRHYDQDGRITALETLIDGTWHHNDRLGLRLWRQAQPHGDQLRSTNPESRRVCSHRCDKDRIDIRLSPHRGDEARPSEILQPDRRRA
jgi:YD repeat-containing protein